jgi:hypothetical protein
LKHRRWVDARKTHKVDGNRCNINDEGVIIKAVDQARRRQFDAGSDYNGLQVDLVAENGASRRHIKPQRQRAIFLCELVAAANFWTGASDRFG